MEAVVVVVGGGGVATSRLGPGQVVEESQACICKVVKTHPVLAKVATEDGDWWWLGGGGGVNS